MRSSKRALQLDQRDRLLAALGRVDQRRHQRRVVARAVDGLLDREHVRVGDGLLDEALDRGREGDVGVVHEQVAFAHRAEHVGALALVAQQARVGDPDERLLAQLGVAGQLARSATARPCRAARRPGRPPRPRTPSRPGELVAAARSEQSAPTSTRTISPKRRRRSSSSTACSRSAASSETSRSASRVTRKTS